MHISLWNGTTEKDAARRCTTKQDRSTGTYPFRRGARGDERKVRERLGGSFLEKFFGMECQLEFLVLRRAFGL